MTANKRVLVVDDDPDTVEQLSVALNAEGYEVITAGGQQEAEEVLLTTRPDLVVLDLMMEQMDSGFVFAHNLRKLYPGTPVILLTAVAATKRMSFDTQSPEVRSWLKVDRVLDKPVRPEQLRTEVRRLLKEDLPRESEGGAAPGV